MARGIVSGELSGFRELLETIREMPQIADKAIEAGSKAMMEQGVRDLRANYYSIGGKPGDYVDTSIGSYGTPTPTGALPGTDYWASVGVFKLQSVYDSYNAAYHAKQSNSIKKNAMSAAQIGYWIENGTSRLRNGARKPNNYTEDAFKPEELIKTSPKPFISNAFITGWDGQFAAFKVAFDNKIEELT